MSDENNDSGDLVLTDSEAGGVLWKRIEQHLEARLERYRNKNDQMLSPDETTALRARIAEVKNLLAAGQDRD